jgi:hypothetical protein
MSLTPERTTQHYGPGVTSASQSVLLEVMTALRPYRDALVLVGGWVPYFLLQRHQPAEDPFVHVGSIDIDLAVDPAAVDGAEYATIVELLAERGYRPTPDRRGTPVPYSFDRTVPSPITHKPYTIRIDFLTHLDAPSSGRGHGAPIQDDLFARKTKGCEVAFRHQEQFDLTGTLPEGGRIVVPIRMANIVGSLTMKGIVVGERYREKDAYDIYALLAHYGQGPREVAAAMRPHAVDPLVADALARIRQAFVSRDANGPAWTAAFLVSAVIGAEHERLVTDAFMVVDEFNRLVAESPGPARAAA